LNQGENIAEKGPTGPCREPTSQHSEKNLRNDYEYGVDGNKSLNCYKIVPKMQKHDTLLKTKKILKMKFTPSMVQF